MATTDTSFETHAETPQNTSLLIVLAPLSGDVTETLLHPLYSTFPGCNMTVAIAEGEDEATPPAPWSVVRYNPMTTASAGWNLRGVDYAQVNLVARRLQATTILTLGAEARSLKPAGIEQMIRAVADDHCDLVVPQYELPSRSGLVNSAILYPISRALFGTPSRFPLAIDLCLSARMVEQLAIAGQRANTADRHDGLVWPVSEAVCGGFTLGQVAVGPRVLPQPEGSDLNSILAQVAGSLFSDLDAKAAYWQRARVAKTQPQPTVSDDSIEISSQEIGALVESFRMAHVNLAEIWSLVLPPQSLLGLKRLSAMPTESFVMADALWARIVYDFLIAHRLRTINRGHLLGALTPLYLAWVASHLTQTALHHESEQHIEAVASAFEANKPYLVARWRWPDRFNP